MTHDEEEEDLEPGGWQFSLRTLFVCVVIVALASGWLLTTTQQREELRKLRSQLEKERQHATRVLEYVYMTTRDEEIKSRLIATWEKALKVHGDNHHLPSGAKPE